MPNDPLRIHQDDQVRAAALQLAHIAAIFYHELVKDEVPSEVASELTAAYMGEIFLNGREMNGGS